MSAEIRIFNRIIGETFKGIQRARWMNLIIITTMAAILSIYGCLFRTSLFIAHFVQELGDSVEVSVFLKPGREPAAIEKQIKKEKNVKSTLVITKEEAWKDFKKQMELPDMDNCLPDKIRVKLHDRSEVDAFITKVKKLDGVEDVFYAKQLAEQIGKAGHYANIGVVLTILLLGGLTFFIINNTIHLVIESRKQEIEIMQMMGVSNTYIKAPYVLQGVFYGFWAGIFAIIPVLVLNIYLKNISNFFYMPYLYVNTNFVVLVTILTGIIVGGAGSILTVKRYLKV